MRITREMFMEPYRGIDGRRLPRPIERFRAKCRKEGACTVWTGAKNRAGGYGITSYAGQNLYAHRVAWAIANGSLEDDDLVLHRCDNPPCVNPEHLFLGDHKTNSQDMVAKGRHVQVMKPMAPAKLAEILRLSSLGRTGPQIAAAVGYSAGYVCKVIRANREAQA